MATIAALRSELREVQQQLRRLHLGSEAMQYNTSVMADAAEPPLVDPSRVRVLQEALQRREVELLIQVDSERKRRLTAVHKSRDRHEAATLKRITAQMSRHLSNAEAVVTEHHSQSAARNEIQRQRVSGIREKMATQQRDALIKLEREIERTECKSSELVRHQREETDRRIVDRVRSMNAVQARIADFQRAQEEKRESMRQPSSPSGRTGTKAHRSSIVTRPPANSPNRDVVQMSEDVQTKVRIHATRAEQNHAAIAKRCATSLADRTLRHHTRLDELHDERQRRYNARSIRLARHEQHLARLREQQEIASTVMVTHRLRSPSAQAEPPSANGRWVSRALSLMTDVCASVVGEAPLSMLPKGFEGISLEESPAA